MDLDIIGEFECEYNWKDMVVCRDETGSAHVITADEYRKLYNLKPKKNNKRNVA